MNNLGQCLNNYYKTDILDGQNKYNCGNCKRKNKAKKRSTIEVSPRILVIHLKRFNWLGRKINEPVSYPKSISL